MVSQSGNLLEALKQTSPSMSMRISFFDHTRLIKRDIEIPMASNVVPERQAEAMIRANKACFCVKTRNRRSVNVIAYVHELLRSRYL